MDVQAVKDYLLGLQDAICSELSELDGSAFVTDSWDRPEGVADVHACLQRVRLSRKAA